MAGCIQKKQQKQKIFVAKVFVYPEETVITEIFVITAFNMYPKYTITLNFNEITNIKLQKCSHRLRPRQNLL
jgi:hypothetical protein